jgi:hypothetical protein
MSATVDVSSAGGLNGHDINYLIICVVVRGIPQIEDPEAPR